MPPETALDPQNRALYGDILRPPPGCGFDCAVATTYSLDFETALVIPATLAFHAESRQETLDSPLALLEGLERLAGRIAIFCEAGRIQGTPREINRLTALLEDTITEVVAPGGGAFHPKLWLRPLRRRGRCGPPAAGAPVAQHHPGHLLGFVALARRRGRSGPRSRQRPALRPDRGASGPRCRPGHAARRGGTNRGPGRRGRPGPAGSCHRGSPASGSPSTASVAPSGSRASGATSGSSRPSSATRRSRG